MPWLCVAVAAVVLVRATLCQTGTQLQRMEPAGRAAACDGWFRDLIRTLCQPHKSSVMRRSCLNCAGVVPLHSINNY